MIKEVGTSMELLLRVGRWAIIAIIALPIMELHAKEASTPALSPVSEQITASAPSCIGNSELGGQFSDCPPQQRQLIAAAPAEAPVPVAYTQTSLAEPMVKRPDGGVDGSPENAAASGWVVAILISLVGVVAIGRRGGASGEVKPHQVRQHRVNRRHAAHHA